MQTDNAPTDKGESASMAELYYHNDGEQDGGRVQKTHPLPVEIQGGDTGEYSVSLDTTATITTTSGRVVAANAYRKYLILINDSDTVQYVRFNTRAAVANQGVRLNANGGSYEMSKALGNLYKGEIQGIHGGTGDKVLLVTEGIGE